MGLVEISRVYILLFSQVFEYSKVFWERFKELQDSERIESQIEKGEVKIKHKS